MKIHYVLPLVIGILFLVNALIGDNESPGALTELHARAELHSGGSQPGKLGAESHRQSVAFLKANNWDLEPDSAQDNDLDSEFRDNVWNDAAQYAAHSTPGDSMVTAVATTKLTVAGSAVSSPIPELIER